jgi:hypothetical protein
MRRYNGNRTNSISGRILVYAQPVTKGHSSVRRPGYEQIALIHRLVADVTDINAIVVVHSESWAYLVPGMRIHDDRRTEAFPPIVRPCEKNVRPNAAFGAVQRLLPNDHRIVISVNRDAAPKLTRRRSGIDIKSGQKCFPSVRRPCVSRSRTETPCHVRIVTAVECNTRVACWTAQCVDKNRRQKR